MSLGHLFDSVHVFPEHPRQRKSYKYTSKAVLLLKEGRQFEILEYKKNRLDDLLIFFSVSIF